ncbi:short-chain dehydrogenase/reductase 2b-like [Lolium rigidum]|uniref:short-chain dehydrogenase/reductase 2b-like n=1 Tax=Lolium rigidum TaxID=89674 RepID=UPI001F5CEF45|nr:short-chain dehydrogenase/reductase 2b-like [Lolium rigidum]
MEPAAASNPSSKRIAVVTGGNKGVGLETCRQLASRGLRVVLTARNEARGLEAVEGVRRSGGGGQSDVVFHQLDVTDPASVGRLADFVKNQFGKLDILINNAGISGVDRDPALVAKVKEQVESMDVDQRVQWMKENSKETYEEAKGCMRTNYYGAKLVTEALLPLLQLSSCGRIVNVSSGFALLRNFNSEELKKEFDDIDNLTEKRLDELLDLFLEDFKANLIEAHGWPTGGSSAYKVAKAALNAYTRILAKKYPTMRINCLTPGYVKTDMSMHMGVLTPEEGASNPVKVALLPDDGPTGAYFDRNGEASYV